MQYGKIVAVHGSNISISVQCGTNDQVIDGEEMIRRHLDLTLAAGSLADVDYAVAKLGDAVGFSSCNGKLWFPEKIWPTEGGLKA